MFGKISRDVIRSYIALGIDPKKTVIYRQSDFPQITELMWIFSCMFGQQYLTIGHAYKDAVQRDTQPGLGTFLYPMLMAADILLPGAAVVPVGRDQVQHIEIAREVARKFATVTGTPYFTEPRERTIEERMTVPGTDGNKMSKSHGNVLPIFGSAERITAAIKGITTDSTPAGRPIEPGACTVCTYLELLMPREEYGGIANKCTNGTITYKELKETLITVYFEHFNGVRERYAELEKDAGYLDGVLRRHHTRVDELLTRRLREVRDILGFGTAPGRKSFFGRR